MGDGNVVTLASVTAETETSIAVPVESPALAAAASEESASAEQGGGKKFVSQGQMLLDRYKAQFDELMGIHRRMVKLKGVVVNAPGSGEVASMEKPPKEVPFFGGLTMIADGNDAAIKAIKEDLAAVEELF